MTKPKSPQRNNISAGEVGKNALILLKKAGTYADYETCASLFTDALA